MHIRGGDVTVSLHVSTLSQSLTCCPAGFPAGPRLLLPHSFDQRCEATYPSPGSSPFLAGGVGLAFLTRQSESPQDQAAPRSRLKYTPAHGS